MYFPPSASNPVCICLKPAQSRTGFLLLPTTQPNTRGAQKAPRSKTPCYHPSYSKAEIPFPALLFIPAPLLARCHLACAAPPYNPHRCGKFPPPSNLPRATPSPELHATLPAAEPPPQHVQTPRKISLFDNHLPVRLVTLLCFACPPDTSLNAIPRYPPAARPSSPTNKYRPTGYS